MLNVVALLHVVRFSDAVVFNYSD